MLQCAAADTEASRRGEVSPLSRHCEQNPQKGHVQGSHVHVFLLRIRSTDGPHFYTPFCKLNDSDTLVCGKHGINSR